MSVSHYVPPEILERIFQRLPIKTLLRCISVSKNWKSLITHQSFIQQSANNRNNNYLFLQFSCSQPLEWEWEQRIGYNNLLFSIYSDNESVNRVISTTFALGDHYFSVIGISNGLMCLSNCYFSWPAAFILLNPFIKRYVVVPKSTCTPFEYGEWTSDDGEYVSGEYISGFGFDSKNNDFIVIKVFLYYHKTTLWVEVYSLKTGKWGRIIGTNLSSCISAHEIIGNPVLVNENIHWLICVNQSGGGYNNLILSFDCATKTFKELILPECLGFLPYIQLSLLKGGNSLALVQMEKSVFNIWAMKEYGNVNSWSMIFSFNSRCYGHIARVIAIRNSGELVLERRDNEVIFLDPKKYLVECSGLQVRGRDSFAGDLGESLFLINEKSSTSLISSSIVNKTELGIYLKKDS